MPLRLGDSLPSLDGATQWVHLQGDLTDISKGPLLVHFWSVSCYLCKNNFSTLAKWRKTYGPQGLNMIAIHMPRQEEDTNIDMVQSVIEEYSLTEPCAVDNEHTLKDAFQNDQGWVPAYFLFDAEGKLKSRAAGESGVGMLQTALDRLFPKDPQVDAANG